MPAILAVLFLAILTTTTSAAADPVRFAVALGSGARLGSNTSLRLSLDVSDRLPPVTEVRLLTPAGIDLSASGLGMATCVRPEAEILEVMHFVDHDPCPGNALMGTGGASAQLRFDPESVYSASARLRLFAGKEVADNPGLLVIADAYRPVRTQFTYRGFVYVPDSSRFGIGLAIEVTPLPRPLFGAPIALSSFDLTVGDPSLRYARTVRGERTSYQPRGIPLPATCPSGGFRFRAILQFVGGHREVADARARCPRRRA